MVRSISEKKAATPDQDRVALRELRRRQHRLAQRRRGSAALLVRQLLPALDGASQGRELTGWQGHQQQA
ncbi:MAG: hypothetical protein P4L99_05530 [Chthoniobacter sp.]|nr:hypothetical protein [Chthoniobacter sp.]